MKGKKLISVLVATVASVCFVLAFNWLRDNRLPYFTRDADIYVYEDTPLPGLIDFIAEEGGARWPGRLEKVFLKHEVSKYLTPGHYVIKKGSTAVYAARMLNNGWETPVHLVLSGYLRDKGDIARRISTQMMADSASIRGAFEDKELLKEFGFAPETVFALLIPDTYEIYWTATVHDIFARLYAEYKAFWTEENVNKAKKLGLSGMEVSILASIVDSETNYVPEMPKIAGVYLNRLNRGMKLQADPTIAFCYKYKVNRIYRYMLSVDSPYNTYLYAGLPPGPICVPVKEALDAVLNPDYGGGNLFFCADPAMNGTHRFTPSYSQHLKNAYAFQKALGKLSSK